MRLKTNILESQEFQAYGHKSSIPLINTVMLYAQISDLLLDFTMQKIALLHKQNCKNYLHIAFTPHFTSVSVSKINCRRLDVLNRSVLN